MTQKCVKDLVIIGSGCSFFFWFSNKPIKETYWIIIDDIMCKILFCIGDTDVILTLLHGTQNVC